MFDEDNRDGDRRQEWPRRIVFPPGSSEAEAAVIVNLDDESDEVAADPVVFERVATQIEIATCDGQQVDRIDVPALQIRRSEASAEWLEADEGKAASK